MTVSIQTSGTADLADNNEASLATVTASGNYQLMVDLNEMTNGSTPDQVTIRIYQTVLSTGTERLADEIPLEGAQGQTCFRSLPLCLAGEDARFSIQQHQGTLRDFIWAVYQLDG